ncbi:MAG TPA: type II CAAX endopeptidase family protein [Ktedonobacterales bacterium]|nr:type II CAAX endopeptidase family protein [Ktedonobacterales bacterium]
MRSLDDHRPDDSTESRESIEADSAAPLMPMPPAYTSAAEASASGERGITATPWTFRQMVIGALWTLIPWLTFSLGSIYLLGSSTATTTTTSAKPPSVALDAIGGVIDFIISALLEAIFLIAPALVVFSRRLPAAPFRERMRWLGFRTTPLVPAVVIVVVGLVIGLGGSLIYSQLITYFHLPLTTNSETLLREGRTAPLTTLGILAAAALVAPFCEEVFFRGFVFVGLLKRVPLWPSIILSAAIFGVAHADIGSLAPLFIIGLALAWARWRSDSIWPGMVIHAANNTAAALFLLPYLLK